MRSKDKTKVNNSTKNTTKEVTTATQAKLAALEGSLRAGVEAVDRLKEMGLSTLGNSLLREMLEEVTNLLVNARNSAEMWADAPAEFAEAFTEDGGLRASERAVQVARLYEEAPHLIHELFAVEVVVDWDNVERSYLDPELEGFLPKIYFAEDVDASNTEEYRTLPYHEAVRLKYHQFSRKARRRIYGG